MKHASIERRYNKEGNSIKHRGVVMWRQDGETFQDTGVPSIHKELKDKGLPACSLNEILGLIQYKVFKNPTTFFLFFIIKYILQLSHD